MSNERHRSKYNNRSDDRHRPVLRKTTGLKCEISRSSQPSHSPLLEEKGKFARHVLFRGLGERFSGARISLSLTWSTFSSSVDMFLTSSASKVSGLIVVL